MCNGLLPKRLLESRYPPSQQVGDIGLTVFGAFLDCEVMWIEVALWEEVLPLGWNALEKAAITSKETIP